MCYTRAELEQLQQERLESEKKQEMERGKVEEVKTMGSMLEHMPSSLPHDEPEPAPA